MKIFFAHSAIADLDDIKGHYAAEGVPYSGQQFITAIIKQVQTLADNPNVGRVVPEFEEERIRELIHAPFRVVYLREHDSIHIIRVWRSERLLTLPENET